MGGMEDDPKSKSKSVSLLPELWQQVEIKAANDYGFNRSSYIRALIEKDLAGTTQKPDATDENILVELCEKLRPESAEMLGEWLARHGVNQPRLLGKMLEALAETLMRDLNRKIEHGENPLVLMKLLREDAHAVQAAYAFRQLPATSEELAKLFNGEHHKSLAIAAAMEAVKPKPKN